MTCHVRKTNVVSISLSQHGSPMPGSDLDECCMGERRAWAVNLNQDSQRKSHHTTATTVADISSRQLLNIVNCTVGLNIEARFPGNFRTVCLMWAGYGLAKPQPTQIRQHTTNNTNNKTQCFDLTNTPWCALLFKLFYAFNVDTTRP